jgi:hypothetical protein
MVIRTRQQLPATLIKSTSALSLAAGQSALLLGDLSAARIYLESAVKGGAGYRPAALLWLAGVDYMRSQPSSLGTTGRQQEIDLNRLRTFLSEHAQSRDQ